MSTPFSVGRDPRVDETLQRLHDGKLTHDDALKLLLKIGLEQFDEDYNGNESKTRQTIETQRA